MSPYLPLYVAWCFQNSYQILENFPPPRVDSGVKDSIQKFSHAPTFHMVLHLPLYVTLCFSKRYQIYENLPPPYHRLILELRIQRKILGFKDSI